MFSKIICFCFSLARINWWISINIPKKISLISCKYLYDILVRVRDTADESEVEVKMKILIEKQIKVKPVEGKLRKDTIFTLTSLHTLRAISCQCLSQFSRDFIHFFLQLFSIQLYVYIWISTLTNSDNNNSKERMYYFWSKPSIYMNTIINYLGSASSRSALCFDASSSMTLYGSSAGS